MTPAAQQLADAINDHLWRLHTLRPSIVDPGQGDMPDWINNASVFMAAQLEQDEDDRLSAQTAIDIMCLLWPHCAPEDCGQVEWWTTPLGRLIARSLGRDDAVSVSHSVAAAMLGLHKGTVSTMVARGNLERHPDGGVLRASVLRRLGR